MISIQVDSDGIIWYRNEDGEKLREGGPAVIRPDSTKFWFVHGQLHRVDVPAVEWAHGGREWWFEGKKHRSDGPATEWPDGRTWWWTNGKPVSEAVVKSRDTSQSARSVL